MLPTPQIGSEAQFAVLRTFLQQSNYTERSVAEWAEVPAIQLFKTLHDGRATHQTVENVLDALIALFMDSVVMDNAVLERWFPAPVRQVLLELDLIMPVDDAHHATVLLYPVEGVFIISDLTRDPEPGKPVPLAADVVYPAITSSSGRFLRQVSRTPATRFLELCAGTGIAALVGARNSQHAWSLDITERSTHFARFNAALNGITNFTALQGDLFAPVQGMTFDRIVAHPPYVPATEQKIIYRDGGHDGEQITMRILKELHQYLAPGGRYQCTCVASDRAGARLEERVREMLGPTRDEFDVLVSSVLEYEPISYFTTTALEGRMAWENVEPTLRTQRALKVERMVYAHIEVQRRSAPRAVFTARRGLGAANGWPETDWLLKWETALQTDGQNVSRTLLAGKPHVAPATAVQLELRQREPGAWSPMEAGIAIDWPYPLRVKCPPWAADLLAQCDGATPVAEIFGRLQNGGVIPAEGAEGPFIHFILTLAGAGVLVFESMPLPTRMTPSAG